jgi:spermidine/putrescine transport system substrate-binding protein
MPLDQLEEFFASDALTRRRFVGRAGSAALLSAALAACGGVKGTAQNAKPAPTAVQHPKVPIGNWTFSNWPLYIDKKVLKTFDKRYGGHVRYIEDINDNDSAATSSC